MSRQTSADADQVPFTELSTDLYTGPHMGYGTTRISAAAHQTLREMSKAEGKPMLALLDEAVEGLRRQRFLERVNAAYAALRADPAAWTTVLDERRAWDTTLADGLGVRETGTKYARASRRGRGRPRR